MVQFFCPTVYMQTDTTKYIHHAASWVVSNDFCCLVSYRSKTDAVTYLLAGRLLAGAGRKVVWISLLPMECYSMREIRKSPATSKYPAYCKFAQCLFPARCHIIGRKPCLQRQSCRLPACSDDIVMNRIHYIE